MNCRYLLRMIMYIAVALAQVALITGCGKKGAPTLKTFEKPPAVTALNAVHRKDELTISWSYPSASRATIKGFYIEKAEGDPREEFRNIAFLKNDASQFADKEFSTGGSYFYRIRVYSLRDVISDPSPVITVRPSKLPPPPAELSYRIVDNIVEIRWKGVGEGISYNIYKSAERDVYAPAPLNSAPLKEPVFRDAITTERPVYYVVTSVLTAGMIEEGAPSRQLEINPDAFVPSKPSGLNYALSPHRVHLLWNANSETWIGGYRIYRKRDNEEGFSVIGETVTPAFTDRDPLRIKTTYYITALGPKSESIPSDPVTILPLIER